MELEELKGEGHGEIDFSVRFADHAFFVSRTNFDAFVARLWSDEPGKNYALPVQTVELCSLEEVMKVFSIGIELEDEEAPDKEKLIYQKMSDIFGREDMDKVSPEICYFRKFGHQQFHVVCPLL